MNQQKVPPYPVYRPRMPLTWWLRNWRYFLFMMRELSSLFIAIFVLSYVVGIYRFMQGRNSYEAYVDALHAPFSKALYVVILIFSLYHTFTWFQLTPQVMVVRIGRKMLPPVLILIGNYVAWGIISAVLFYLLVVII